MKTRKNFNRGIRLDKICAVDDFKIPLHFISFQDGNAIATNAQCLVVAKISEISNFSDEQIEKLNGKYIHRESFKRLIKEDYVQIVDDGFLCISDEAKQLIYFGEVDNFPNVRSLFVADRCELNKIGIDPSKLAVLQACLPYKYSKLEFGKNKLSTIFVSDAQGAFESKGIVMPFMLND